MFAFEKIDWGKKEASHWHLVLQISDADNIMGVVHTEPIQVIAEAYDVALDLSFPKGKEKLCFTFFGFKKTAKVDKSANISV